MNSCRVCTRCQWQIKPASSSMVTSSSASTGLSSSSSRRSLAGAPSEACAGKLSCRSGFTANAHGGGRSLIDQQPEDADLLDYLDKVVEGHRLDDVGVDARLISLNHIRLFPRRGQYHDGSGRQLRVAFDAPQGLQAV